MRTKIIVNPQAAGGAAGKGWPDTRARLEAAIGAFDAELTAAPGEATALARQAMADGYKRIVAVGGDGTVNEVVNGLFADGKAPGKTVSLGYIACGTGGDFRKTHGIGAGVEAGVATLATGKPHAIDVGRLKFVDHDGRPAERYFANIASFGMSGLVDRAVNSATWSKRLGGGFAFYWASLTSMLRYRNKVVRITIDGGFDQDMVVNTAAICIGRYFGSGMFIAPKAAPDDGLFDVVILGDFKIRHLIFDSPMLYKGTHLGHPRVTLMRGREVSARSEATVYLDVDGENPGRLPASFGILPGALRLVR